VYITEEQVKLSRHMVVCCAAQEVCCAAQETGVPQSEYIDRKEENMIFTPI